MNSYVQIVHVPHDRHVYRAAIDVHCCDRATDAGAWAVCEQRWRFFESCVLAAVRAHVPRWPGRQLFAFVDFLLEVCATARTAAHGARVRTDCAVCVRSSRTAADALAADADAASGMRVRCPPVGRVTPRPALASPSLAQPRCGGTARPYHSSRVTQLP